MGFEPTTSRTTTERASIRSRGSTTLPHVRRTAIAYVRRAWPRLAAPRRHSPLPSRSHGQPKGWSESAGQALTAGPGFASAVNGEPQQNTVSPASTPYWPRGYARSPRSSRVATVQAFLRLIYAAWLAGLHGKEKVYGSIP